MRIQIASDFHLDSHTPATFPQIDPVGDILALVGDIGNPYHHSYWDFICPLVAKYRHVLLVPGNHEYFGHTIRETNQLLRKKCKEFGILLLVRSSIIIDDIRFIGATLWNAPTKEDYDFYVQHRKPELWINNMTHEKYQRMHKNDCKFIEGELQKDRTIPTVVLTHYPPIKDPYILKNGTAPSMRVPDLPHILQSPVRIWICGHSHINGSFTRNGIRIVSNCYGYPSELKTAHDKPYSPRKTVRISA
jgi:predicted phosphohydrolase